MFGAQYILATVVVQRVVRLCPFPRQRKCIMQTIGAKGSDRNTAKTSAPKKPWRVAHDWQSSCRQSRDVHVRHSIVDCCTPNARAQLATIVLRAVVFLICMHYYRSNGSLTNSQQPIIDWDLCIVFNIHSIVDCAIVHEWAKALCIRQTQSPSKTCF